MQTKVALKSYPGYSDWNIRCPHCYAYIAKGQVQEGINVCGFCGEKFIKE